jgi:ankyrin repeat protein
MAASSPEEAEKGMQERALLRAAGAGDLQAVQQSLAAGVNVDAQRFGSGLCALHVACQRNRVEVVKVLIASKANIEAEDRFGRRPLHFASESIDGIDCVKPLLGAGADLHAATKDGRLAIFSLASRGLDMATVNELARFILSKGIPERGPEGQTLLHEAAMNGNEELCRMLCKVKPEWTELKDEHGRTPIFLAALYCLPGTIRILAEAECIPACDDARESLIMACCGRGFARLSEEQEAALTLLEYGAVIPQKVPSWHIIPGSGSGNIPAEGIVAESIRYFLSALFSYVGPISINRRALRFALTSPTVAQWQEDEYFSPMRTAASDEERREMIDKRLSLLRKDARKRRCHLAHAYYAFRKGLGRRREREEAKTQTGGSGSAT